MKFPSLSVVTKEARLRGPMKIWHTKRDLGVLVTTAVATASVDGQLRV